ncbi:MAG: MBOAT family protein [Acidobacteria bacterium]|nr:MBOAT family protein [Acidobacteriota bacterium]
MNLSEAPFLLFLACAVPLCALASLRTKRLPPGLLAGLALFFYATWNPLFLLPLLATAGTDFLAGRRIAAARGPARRAWLALSLAVDLGLLLAFKAWDPLVAGLSAFHPLHPAWRLVAFTGLSFYTFQSLSYVLDVYRGDQEAEGSFPRYLAFVSFFPTILAGPITRAGTLLPQLAGEARVMDPDLAARGFFLVATGFLKKAAADHLAVQLVDRVFEQPGFFSSLEVAGGVYAYAAQIYLDFSGYSDIAIGAALFLGIRLKDNFNRPYRSASLAEFWKRWHISFSTWLMDYVFFALPGKRRKAGPYAALVATFLVGGLWHGASWTFLAWGALHGLGLAAWRLAEPKARGPRVPRPVWKTVLLAGLTFHVVCLGWIFFRADGMEQARQILSRLGDLTTGRGNLPLDALLITGGTLAVQWLPEGWWDRLQARFAEQPAPVQALALASVALLVRSAAGARVASFIYQAF